MKKLLFLLFIIPLFSISQTQIQGVVLNSKTKTPLPFASITTNTNFGSLTDIEGTFHLKTQNTFNEITVSYIGYKTVKIPITSKDKFLTIKLKPSVENLNEVLITAKENPALKIIRNTIANKPTNDIEKALNSFKFNTYNKILVTANPDSITGKIDSVFTLKNNVKKFSKLDSTNYKFKKEIDKQHLYISEKISEFKFKKGKKKKEVIIGSRMAGFNQPIYEILALTIQDLSIYNEVYTIAGTKYTNPIANNALKHYNYKILDTVLFQNRTAILIHFKPKEKKDFSGIEGVLYVDSKTFGITKAITEIKGMLNIKATQNYSFNKKHAIWFPKDMNIVLRKGDNNKNINLFGGMVHVSRIKQNDSLINTRSTMPGDIIYFISKSINSKININTPVTIKRASSTIQFNDDAYKKSNEFWNKYRTDSLTNRGKTAYKIIDSIGKSEGFEKKLNLARNILKGYYYTKYLNLNLGKIINLNNYEGLRIGFGGETNINFSHKFKVETYVAYGTKDKDYKYSFGLSARLNKDKNTWVGANFTDDIKEAASLDFIAENNSFSPINPRNLNISKFFNYKTISTFLKHDIQPNLETKLQLSTGRYTPLFDYRFISATKDLSEYTLTTATLGLQYSPKNEYLNAPLGKITTKKAYPQYTLQLTKSIDNFLNSDFDFTQLNLRIQYILKRFKRATTNFLLEGGVLFGDAPISHLFNSTPNYTLKNPWSKRVTFAGKNSFETMRYNEFISDRFVAIHLKHEFTSFKISSKFKPQLSLVTRTALGNVNNPDYHNGLTFKRLNKGYFESGIELNSLIKGFGLSAFYRYGAYKNTEWSDNLALKLTYKLRLGF